MVVSWLVLSFCFSFSREFLTTLILFPIALIVVGTAFVLHELGHRWIAKREGLIASYRMWSLGLALALLTAIITEIAGRKMIFAAPGAVYIAYPISPLLIDPDILKGVETRIAMAGPLTNILLAMAFWLATPMLPGQTLFLTLLSRLGFSVNAFLAFFNLLPFPPMDGWKLFRGNIRMWIVLFAISLILMSME